MIPAFRLDTHIVPTPALVRPEQQPILADLAKKIQHQRQVIANAQAHIEIYTAQYRAILEQLKTRQEIEMLERQIHSPSPLPIASPRPATPTERLKSTTDTNELLKLVSDKVEGVANEVEIIEPPKKRGRYTPQIPTPPNSLYGTSTCFFAPINMGLPFHDQTYNSITPSPASTPEVTQQISQPPLVSPAPSPTAPSRPESPWQQYLVPDTSHQ